MQFLGKINTEFEFNDLLQELVIRAPTQTDESEFNKNKWTSLTCQLQSSLTDPYPINSQIFHISINMAHSFGFPLEESQRSNQKQP